MLHMSWAVHTFLHILLINITRLACVSSSSPFPLFPLFFSSTTQKITIFLYISIILYIVAMKCPCLHTHLLYWEHVYGQRSIKSFTCFSNLDTMVIPVELHRLRKESYRRHALCLFPPLSSVKRLQGYELLHGRCLSLPMSNSSCQM